MAVTIPHAVMKIRWGAPDGANVFAPAKALALLRHAIAAQPENAGLRARLGCVALDAYDFRAAAEAFEAALGLDSDSPDVRPRLAGCYNYLHRPQDALDMLERHERPEHERALAYLALGRQSEAEAEWRALLHEQPHFRPALRQLGKILRRTGRIGELLETCQALADLGVRHAQLLYVWGTALALAGEHERARAILVDSERIGELQLPVPDGFDDIAQFNAALAEEILDSPYALSEFPLADQAPRGTSRVHALFAGRRPELVHGLIASLQRLVEGWPIARRGPFDPWFEARPDAAHVKGWGLLQRGQAYEEWHFHAGGWLSGVYYVRVPKAVSAAGEGPGCIEFGPPSALQRALPGYADTLRFAPREGMALLAPSHYAHRTIPTGVDEHRISFAFDVVPE